MKKVDTIIVGAGIAGIGAAKTLYSNDPKYDFKIITENIGGRIASSDDGEINYGAYVINSSYTNVLQLVTRHKLVNLLNLRLYDKSLKPYMGYGLLLHPIQLFRLGRIILNFNKHFAKFKVNAAEIGQKRALENDEMLLGLYSTSMKNFARRHKIDGIVEKYFSYGAYAFSFTHYKNISAFDFLRIIVPIIVRPYSTFSFDANAVTVSFKDKVIYDKVLKLKKTPKGHEITTKKRKYLAKNVIVATDPTNTKKLVKLKAIKKPVDAYMFHIEGNLNRKWRNFSNYMVFNPEHKDIVIAKQKNGNFLFYSKVKKPNFSVYFDDHKIIHKKHWKPAFNLRVDAILIEQKINDELYIAGDFNLVGIEEAYLTGVFAAQQILKNT